MEVNYVITPHSEFAVQKLNEEGFKKAEMMRNEFDRLLSFLKEVCMDGREFSILKTKLEEACFFAKKSMALNINNQEKPNA